MTEYIIGLPAELHSLIFVTDSSPTYKIIKMHPFDGMEMTAITNNSLAALLKTVYVSIYRIDKETKKPTYYRQGGIHISILEVSLFLTC